VTARGGKPRLFLLFPGPRYDVAHDFGVRFERLSERYEGIALTSTPEESETALAAFTLTTVSISGTGTHLDTLRFFAAGIRLAWRERRAGRRIDLVVSYDPLKTGILGILVTRILGTKLATEINGNYATPANYVDQPARRAAIKRRLYTTVEKFVVRHSDGLKLLFPEQLDFCRSLLGGKVVRSFFDFVDLRPFANLGEEKVILFAGFPFFLKGVDVLIRAFRAVAPAHPDWQLKILGWYPRPLASYLDLAEHPQIFHHAAVHHRDMPAHIGHCAMLVLPSRSEAMGRVLLEAMAAAKPRIGSRVGGIPTVIEDGCDGMLFESENVDQLAGLLDALIRDPQRRRELGEAGRARAAKEFSLELYFEKLDEFYRSILGTRAR
jgi:glycosyltransferase involved in cell wall biosynthesis